MFRESKFYLLKERNVTAWNKSFRGIKIATAVRLAAAISAINPGGLTVTPAISEALHTANTNQKVQAQWAIAAGVPTPGPGAMTVFEISNPNPDKLNPLMPTANITDTLGFDLKKPIAAVDACRTNQYHLSSDFPEVPSPFTGAMTLFADRIFTAEVVGYDYPGVIPDITSRLRQLVNRLNPTTNKVTTSVIQFIAGRWNSTSCDTSIYDKDADLINSQNQPYARGIITTAPVQLAAGHWGETMALVTNQPQTTAAIKPLVTTGTLGDANLRLLPSDTSSVKPGDVVTVTLKADTNNPIGSHESTITFDPQKLRFKDRHLGPALSSTGRPVTSIGPELTNSEITSGAYSLGASPKGPNGNGLQLEELVFEAVAPGVTKVTAEAEISDELGNPIMVTKGSEVVVTIQGIEYKVIHYLPVITKP